MDLKDREQSLQERLERLAKQEQELLRLEREAKEREKAKKQVLLRLSPSLWDQIAALAADDFRSINGEIEYLLTQAVKTRRGK